MALPVDGGEGEGADVEGVARVILQLHFVGALLLAQRQHLPRLRRNLHRTTGPISHQRNRNLLHKVEHITLSGG
jgi:hypothetical protein